MATAKWKIQVTLETDDGSPLGAEVATSDCWDSEESKNSCLFALAFSMGLVLKMLDTSGISPTGLDDWTTSFRFGLK